MAKIHSIKATIDIGWGTDVWRADVNDNGYPVSVLCCNQLNRLVEVDETKPLWICVSEKKPRNDCAKFRITSDVASYMYFVGEEFKRRDIYTGLSRFIGDTAGLTRGYIWLEQKS